MQPDTTPIGAPAPRYKIGYRTDEWGERSSTPGGIPDPAGAWVRYDDHVAALATQKTPAMNDNAAAPLSDGRILGIWPNSGMPRELIAFARCVEAAHGIGNGGMSEFRCVRRHVHLGKIRAVQTCCVGEPS